MSGPGNPAEREVVIGRLRELHGGADDDDRPRAALLLGLALADFVGRLPDGDPRRGELAQEGLARLAESADHAASAAAACELLRGCLAAAPDEPAAAPGSFPLQGGDLNWDLDWPELRGPAEAARNLTATLPLISSMLPPHDPLGRALRSITDLMAAFDQGHWSPASDEALAAAITQVEASGLGAGLGLLLRAVAMLMRGQRCQQILRDGGRPDWPSAAELDALIADLESADELAAGFGGPFQAVEGLQHMFIGCVILLRLQVGVRGPDVRRDEAWRDGILRLLDLAGDHLRQTPPAYAGLIQSVQGKLAEMSAALSRGPWPPPARSAAAPSPAPPAPQPPAAPPAPQPPPAPPVTGDGGAGQDAEPRIFDPAVGQVSQQVLDGLKILVDQSEGAVPTGLAAMLLAMDAANSRRWTPEHGDRLAELQQQADGLAGEGQSPRDRAAVAAMMAVANAVGTWQRLTSPQLADHPSADEMAEVAAQTESALKLVQAASDAAPDRMLDTLRGPLQAIAAMELVDLSQLDAQHRAELLARARAHFGQLPAEMLEVSVISEMLVLEKLIEGVIPPDAEAVTSVIDLSPNKWDQSGSDLSRVMHAVGRAGRSRAPADVGTALLELQAVWIGLPAGSPLRARVLSATAAMQIALLTQEGGHLRPATADIAATAIAAVRAAAEPDEMQAAAQMLTTVFTLMLSRGESEGPFQEAEDALRTGMDRFAAGDWAMRVTALTGIGAAAAMRAAESGDEAPRVASRRALDEAVRLLPEPAPTAHWYTAARTLCAWAAADGQCHGSTESALVAVGLIDLLEGVLVSHPELDQATGPAAEPAASAPLAVDGLRRLRLLLTEQAARPQDAGRPTVAEQHRRPPRPTGDEARRTAQGAVDRAAAALAPGPGRPARRPLAAAGRPDQDALRSMAAQLHEALACAVGTRLRQQVHRLLGICHAELHWAGPADATGQALREAVVHLNGSLMAGEHALPAVEWAETLDVLARCLREASRGHEAPAPLTPERVARAALRELADCVMIADAAQAVETAARANEITARAIGWCLEDDRARAAVDVAETGRALVLASAALSGRAEEILRGAGRADDSDAWRSASETGRATALAALRETTAGRVLLSTPIGEEISITMVGTQLDAVVYLVPPAEPGPDRGHAILVRPVLGQVEVVELPGLTGPRRPSPLGGYLAALDRALAVAPPAFGGDGFRGGPEGQAWASALDELGRWAYDRIVGPILEHVRGWSLGHLPRLALIPVGELAAIPYAAAWTAGPAAGERRYAIDEAVLSYAASARLLGEVARRPRRPLAERVVLVSSPTGELHMMRRATRLLARRQYPGATVYGTRSAPDGPATCDVLLAALPARQHQGASLLQITTHGTLAPVPAVQAADGWLALARILDQARERAPDAPGGLVITNACLTDTARANYDESLTLATAFQAAGATGVIGTRWPVDDDTATVLVLRLHYHLQTGCHPAEALRRAQRDLIRPTPAMRATLEPALADLSDARLGHPASWAGHVHHGI